MLGLRYKLGTIIAELLTAISLGLALLLLMLLGRIAVRMPWPAAIVFCLLLTALLALSAGYDTAMPWLTYAVMVTGVVLVLSRVGLVAVVVGLFVRLMLTTHPITADPAAWYAPAGGFAVAVVAGLLAYGFFTSLTRQPLLGHRLLDR